jgi:HSP20 family protein
MPVFFDEFLGDLLQSNKVFNPNESIFSKAPAINISESETEYQIELAAAGMSKSDFKISIEQNLLSISTEKPEENTEGKLNYTRKEFGYLVFKRNFTLPEGKIDTDKIEAKYDAGVLKLILPKIVEQELKSIKTIVIE